MPNTATTETSSTPLPVARIGVIGTGWWASDYHLPGLKEHPAAEIVAICDKNPDRLQKAAQAFQIEHTYTDYQQMIEMEELDGVIIVTPHATHHAIAKYCLEHDLHILLEKPMTLYAWEARELVELAEQHKKEIVIGYPYPFFHPIIRAREILQSGELGAIQYVDSAFCSDITKFLSGEVSPDNAPVHYKVQGPSEAYNNPELMGGGEGHLQLTHSIGALLFVTDLRVRKVNARMSNLGLKLDMVDTMIVEYENGAIGTVSGSGNAGRNHRMALAIYCEKGCIVSDSIFMKVIVRHPDGSEEDLGKLYRDGSHHPTTHNFVDVVLGKAANGSPGLNGWRVVELLDAAYRSAQKDGQSISVNELYS